MRVIIRLALAALSAVMAFSAVAADGAWAVEESTPAFLPSAGHIFPLKFTSSGGSATLNTASSSFECTSTLDFGKILAQPSTTSSMLGDIELLLHKCTTVVGGVAVTCKSSGQPAGLIQTPLYLFHIGRLITLPNGKKDVLIVILGRETTFECGGITVKIIGNLVGVISETNKAGEQQFNKQRTNIEIEFTQKAAGEQSFTAFENTLPIEKIEKLELEVVIGGAKERASKVTTVTETIEPAGETVELKG
jgi:hypothetical protein